MSTYTSPQDGNSVVNQRIVAGSPDTPAGSSTISIGETNIDSNILRSLFSIPGAISSISDSSIVISASLFLKISIDYSSNARTFRVFRAKRNVVISEATWNSYSTGNLWQTAGGFGANDCEQTDIGSVSMTASETVGTWKEFVLTPSAIQDIIRGIWDTPYLLIKADTESNDRYDFYGSGSATSENRPYIVIEYGNDLSPMWIF